MADLETTPPAPLTPPVVDKGDSNWRDEYFKIKSEKDDLAKKYGALTTEADTLKAQATSVQQSGVELLRIKKSYEAGVPSHLLNLVTGSTDEEISGQIKTIMGELIPAPVLSPAPSNGEAPVAAPVVAPAAQIAPSIPAPPLPSGIPGESDLDKYTKATPEERQKMMEGWKDNKDGFVLK